MEAQSDQSDGVADWSGWHGAADDSGRQPPDGGGDVEELGSGARPLPFICGFSPQMIRCCWYHTNVNTLLRYLKNFVRYFSYDPETDIGRFQERGSVGKVRLAERKGGHNCPPLLSLQELLLPDYCGGGTVAGARSAPALLCCRGAAGEPVRSPGDGCHVPARLSLPLCYRYRRRLHRVVCLRRSCGVANPTGVFAPPSSWAWS